MCANLIFAGSVREIGYVQASGGQHNQNQVVSARKLQKVTELKSEKRPDDSKSSTPSLPHQFKVSNADKDREVQEPIVQAFSYLTSSHSKIREPSALQKLLWLTDFVTRILDETLHSLQLHRLPLQHLLIQKQQQFRLHPNHLHIGPG